MVHEAIEYGAGSKAQRTGEDGMRLSRPASRPLGPLQCRRILSYNRRATGFSLCNEPCPLRRRARRANGAGEIQPGFRRTRKRAPFGPERGQRCSTIRGVAVREATRHDRLPRW